MDQFKSATYGDVPEVVRDEFWKILNFDKVLYAMQVVSDFGMPAVVGAEKCLLEAGLVERLNASDFDKEGNDRRKRCIGAMVRQIMENNGYIICENEKQTPAQMSSVFLSGSCYHAVDANDFEENTSA